MSIITPTGVAGINSVTASSTNIGFYDVNGATAQINVGAGITINSSGINVVGTVTATTFVGNGSGLSGISASQWVSTAAGIHTLSSVGIGTTNPTAKLSVSGNAVGNIVGIASTTANITLDFSTGNNFSILLPGSLTITNPSNLVAGQSGFISIVQDATGSRLVGWGTFWDFPNSVPPTLTTTANGVDVVAYYVRTTTSIIADAVIGIGTL